MGITVLFAVVFSPQTGWIWASSESHLLYTHRPIQSQKKKTREEKTLASQLNAKSCSLSKGSWPLPVCVAGDLESGVLVEYSDLAVNDEKTLTEWGGGRSKPFFHRHVWLMADRLFYPDHLLSWS